MIRLSARDVMTPNVVTLGDHMTTQEVAKFLIEREISGAPVVDELGRLVGVISITDIARVAAEPADGLGGQPTSDFYRADEDEPPTLEDLGQRYVEQHGLPIRDVMSPVVHAVREATSVAEVARLMIEGHLHRVLVTRGADAVGIITTMDLLKVLADAE